MFLNFMEEIIVSEENIYFDESNKLKADRKDIIKSAQKHKIYVRVF